MRREPLVFGRKLLEPEKATIADERICGQVNVAEGGQGGQRVGQLDAEVAQPICGQVERDECSQHVDDARIDRLDEAVARVDVAQAAEIVFTVVVRSDLIGVEIGQVEAYERVVADDEAPEVCERGERIPRHAVQPVGGQVESEDHERIGFLILVGWQRLAQAQVSE